MIEAWTEGSHYLCRTPCNAESLADRRLELSRIHGAGTGASQQQATLGDNLYSLRVERFIAAKGSLLTVETLRKSRRIENDNVKCLTFLCDLLQIAVSVTDYKFMLAGGRGGQMAVETVVVLGQVQGGTRAIYIHGFEARIGREAGQGKGS